MNDRSRRTRVRVAIGAVALAGATMIAPARGASGGKKLIESGYDEPDTRFIRAHIAEMEQSPFDGLLFHVVSDHGDSLTWHIWSHKRFERSDFDGAVNDLDSTRFRKFTEMFLRVNSSPGDVSWFDDEGWATVAHNFGVAARIARDGRCRGLVFDAEQYFTPLFDYPRIQKLWPGSFEQYSAAVKQRGREWIRAINAEFPGVTLVMTVGYAPTQPHGLEKRSSIHYGLLADFLDGVIEAMSPETRVVDGWEASFAYREKNQFKTAYDTMRKKAVGWTASPDRYKRQVRAGFGIWLDNESDTRGWDAQDHGKNYRTPSDFERTVSDALATTDGYVWIYSQKARWWSGPRVPKAYVDALARAKAAHR